MARRQRRPTKHDFRIGELVSLTAPAAPFAAGDVLQVAGFRGGRQLRVQPLGGVPVTIPCAILAKIEGAPAGSEKPPRRRPRRKRAAATA